MNTELLREIIEGLKEVSPRKAKRVEKLLKRYEAEKDETKKRDLKSWIHQYVYHVLGLCMDKESRFIMQNMGQTIGNQERAIQRQTDDGWAFGYAGVARVLFKDGKPVITNFIPRDYQKGFYLQTPENMSPVDKEREITFYFNHADQLASIARDLDTKQAVYSGAYQTRSPKIKRELCEKMIDFCELTRIKDNQALQDHVRQFVK